MTVDVPTLKAMLRGLLAFRAYYEISREDTATSVDGIEWCLWDVEYLFEQAVERLPKRQAQAIEFCLVHNMTEADAATRMGIRATNPVSMYANDGLCSLVAMIERGELPKFRHKGGVVAA